MLQIQTIKENPEWVKNRLLVKQFNEISLVDEIILLDEKRRKLLFEIEENKALQNVVSKAIGALMQAGNKEEANSKKLVVVNLKETIAAAEIAICAYENELYENLVQLPNLPAQQVPPGKTPNENEIVKEGGFKPSLAANALPHWDICKKYNLVDFELGTKIAGAGFPVYIGKGAKLQRCLTHFFLDYNTNAGYTEYLPPFMVNADSAFGTGQLPDKEGQMYHATEDKLFLIPTAEVPVTNLYRDVIIKEEDLPIKMTAYSPCFRREAGSYGKDVRGLNRVHQFEKVEIIQITHPSKSYGVLDEMVAHVEKLLQLLALPYRILRLCGGDMSFASAITYDFEVWSAAQQRWLEVSSVSNFETFQTNRLKCRYKAEGGKTQLCHTLNGSSLALPRIVAALLENNQTETGINLPTALHSYFGKEKIED